VKNGKYYFTIFLQITKTPAKNYTL
jgi:hypothetical protein